ncbi:MAG: hypothetical protein ABMA64_14930 [Myxococcota bacterium]
MRTWLLALAACTGDGEADPCADAPTWDGFAEGYVQTWCLPCHSAIVTGPDRQGAPEGLDFDQWSEVYPYRDRFALRATGEVPEELGPMPPMGGVPQSQVELLGEWLACGANGHDDPPGPCDAPATTGPVAVASQAEADAWCSSVGPASAASVTVTGDAALGCLCAVDGELRVEGGRAEFPLLTSVDGDLVGRAGALSAPELARVGGAVEVAGSQVTEWATPSLADVGGRVAFDDAPALGSLELDHLHDVGGEMIVRGLPLLGSLHLPRLRSVGGDLVIEGLSGLTALTSTQSLESVRGSLILRQLPQLPVLDDWQFVFLYEVGGDVVIADNPAMLAIHGFPMLGCAGAFPSQIAPDCSADWAMPGSLIIEGNDALQQVPGFDNLEHIAGDLVLRDNATLDSVQGLIHLARIDGALVLEDLRTVANLSGFGALATAGELRMTRIGEVVSADFPRLTAIDRDLRVQECPKLSSILGFPLLTQVGGTFSVTNNVELVDISGFGPLQRVGGDFEVVDNPVLSTHVVESWLSAVDVGGSSTVSGNGP